MFEVVFPHEIEYVLSVEVEAVYDVYLFVDFRTEWHDASELELFCPAFWEVDV